MKYEFPGCWDIIFDLIYFLGLLIASPWLIWRSMRTGRYRTGWAGRLGRLSPDQQSAVKSTGRRILLHCVSVGELASVAELVQELLRLGDDIQVVISVTTDTGMARGIKLYPPGTPRVVVVRYPLDFSLAVRRFLDSVRPTVVGLIELEMWPNFLTACHQRGIAVDLINGRMTNRSFRRYQWVRPIMRSMLRRLRHIGVQSDDIGRRLIDLGADTKKITVRPTMKYDTADFSTDIAGADVFAAALGILPEHWLLTAGSTGPGEEIPLLDTYQALRPRFSQLRLCIAPRKPEVYAQVMDAISQRGLKVVRRSECRDDAKSHPLAGEEVVMLDTFGELKKAYAISGGIFSGRSLVPLGGSDMIEAVALGKPVCFGPHTWNFSDVVAALRAVDGAIQIAGPEELTGTVEKWLTDQSGATLMAQRGRRALLGMRGSSSQYARSLLGLAASEPGCDADIASTKSRGN